MNSTWMINTGVNSTAVNSVVIKIKHKNFAVFILFVVITVAFNLNLQNIWYYFSKKEEEIFGIMMLSKSRYYLYSQ